MKSFEYGEAFSRNLGWISEFEQLKLKEARVAIAGMGGVGGVYLLTCVRMGIEKFSLSEFDTFELGNFNRQVGSSMLTVGRSKLEVMIEQARAINPNVDIRSFPEGISPENVQDFLEGCSVYLDGIDFFEMGARRTIFKEVQRKGLVAVTSAPAAMGFAQLVFAPGCPDFDEFFDFASYPKEYDSLLFLVGLAPKGLHRASLFDASRIHFADRKVSSTMMGCYLCAGAVVTEAVKHILDRGTRLVAPHGLHYDAHSNRFAKTCLRRGNKSLLQKLKIKIALKEILKKNTFAYPYHNAYKDDPLLLDELKDVLDLGRWAPSGDNMQPFTVKSVSKTSVHVSLHEIEVYFQKYVEEDMRLLSFGVYFETLRQAATLFGYAAQWQKTQDPLTYEISFEKQEGLLPEETAPYIRTRFTDRRPYKTTPLTDPQSRVLLQETLGEGYRVVYNGDKDHRKTFAHREMDAMGIILGGEESIHQMVDYIDFENPYSTEKIPFESLGFSFLTKSMVRFFMKRPHLMALFSKFKLSLPVQYEYSYVPHVHCAGHFAIVRDSAQAPQNMDTRLVEDGQMIQRFWLKAASQGIALQPAYLQTAIAKSRHWANASGENPSYETAQKIKKAAQDFISGDPQDLVFMGRIGTPMDRRVYARSTRHKI